MNHFRKSAPAEDRITRAQSDLRRQAAALEAEVARGRERLAQLRAEAVAVEARAMEAIRAGHDRPARNALLAHLGAAEEAAAIDADIRVLDAILAECSAYLGAAPRSASPAARDLAPPT